MSQTGQLTEERLTASSVYDALAQVLLTELIFTAALCYGMWKVGREESGALIMVSCSLGAYAVQGDCVTTLLDETRLQLAINMLYMCVTSISIGFHMNGAASARTNSDEIHEILDEAPGIECEQNRQPESIMIKKDGGAIRFDNVHFSYPSRPDIEVDSRRQHMGIDSHLSI
jgi:ABC-type multidrug transport system fused ATPase/permease subunit